LDIEEKLKAQEKVRENFKRAIALLDESHRPIRIEIPFHGTVIPGYLRLTTQPNNPLLIIINGLDNIKEIENQYPANFLTETGLNVFAFDGPGSGEMCKTMKMIPNYEQVLTAIIDWFEHNNNYKLNLTKIGTFGMSFGPLRGGI
jgi:dienelactone hydrolase